MISALTGPIVTRARFPSSVTAVIVPRDGSDVSLEEIKELCKGKIAGYKIPKAIELVDKIPRNETGKVIKRELRDRFTRDS